MAVALAILAALGCLWWIVVAVLAARMVRAVPRLESLDPPEPSPRPRVSLVVAACDEADTLPAAAETWLALDVDEIVVVDDRSKDDTPALVDALAARDPRVRAVCGLAPASEPFVGRRAFEPGELPFDRGCATLIVAAEEDVLVDLETSVRPLFERLGAPRALVGVRDSDHFHFCDGIPLLHGMHERNPRPGQPRPTRQWKPLVDSRARTNPSGVST